MRNMWTKYFYYFQGLRELKCHRTKRSNRVNYRSKWLLQKTFLVQPPLPPGFPESLTPPPVRISRIPSVREVWIFSGITHSWLVKQRPKKWQSFSVASFAVKTGFSEQVIQSSVRGRHGYNPKLVDRKWRKPDIAFWHYLDNIYANL